MLTRIMFLHILWLIIGHSNIQLNNMKLELLNVKCGMLCVSKMETTHRVRRELNVCNLSYRFLIYV